MLFLGVLGHEDLSVLQVAVPAQEDAARNISAEIINIRFMSLRPFNSGS